jgi:pyridoxal phosphate enzyme (YggS family)
MEDYGFVSGNVQRVRDRIRAAAERAGRDPEGVSLMAVTKFHPLAAVEAAYATGIRLFGENRVQEAETKYSDIAQRFPGARVELIGSLQSNKARKACALFSAVESVDSLGLLEELDKRARAQGTALDILFELHTGEESKAGFPDRDSLFEACDLLCRLAEERRATGAAGGAGGLSLRGLMTMAPFTREEAPVRASFRSLKAAFEELRSRYQFPSFDVLSMGMTNDYEIAIEEGSTLVRIGTALFGARSPA